MYLPSLNDRELAHHADVTFDALTATDLQIELTKRFTALLDENEANASLIDVLDDNGIDAADELRKVFDKVDALDEERVNGLALLDVLLEFDIDDPAVLKKLLQRDAQLTDVLDSLAQPLADLQALATTA